MGSNKYEIYRIRIYEMNSDTVNEILKDTEVEIELPIKIPRGRLKTKPIPKPPKPEKHSLYLDYHKAYFRKYYNDKIKTIIICPSCQHDYTCKSSLDRHLRYNKDCHMLRLQQQLDNTDESLINKEIKQDEIIEIIKQSEIINIPSKY